MAYDNKQFHLLSRKLDWEAYGKQQRDSSCVALAQSVPDPPKPQRLR
jgi:hypothetical protein